MGADEIERYARHLVLPEIGGAGQQRLRAARALVIGAGGLGSPAILYLAAAGVGTLRVADDDAVSLSNLQRQVIHGTRDVGRAKTASAQAATERLNPHVRFEGRGRFDAVTADALLADVDVALDGSDNFETRYALADACRRLRVPLVTAAVGRFDGSLTTIVPDGPAYRDLFPEPPPPGTVAPCAEAGVLGVVTGVMGALQAAEAVKLLAGAGEPLVGRLLLVDVLAMRFETIVY